MRSDSATTAIIEAVDRLPVPRPFTLERFVRALRDTRRKPVELVETPLGGTAPCGWLIRTSQVDYVCYPSNTSWSHQLHIVLHEIGHLVLGHSGGALLLRRSQRDTSDERAAETFATLAARRITRVDHQVIEWNGPRGVDVIALGDVFDIPDAVDDGS
jgi:hypothetical protein